MTYGERCLLGRISYCKLVNPYEIASIRQAMEQVIQETIVYCAYLCIAHFEMAQDYDEPVSNDMRWLFWKSRGHC